MWVSNYGAAIGGGPTLAPLLAEALALRNHEICVLTDRRPESLAETEVRNGVVIHRPLFRRALAGDETLFVSIRKQILDFKDRYRPDVAFVFSSRYGDFFHHLTQRPANPLVVSLHDFHAAEKYRETALLGRHLRTANRVVACSAAVMNAACQHLPDLSSKAVVVRNALPMPSLEGMRRAIRRRSKLVFLGRLIPQKGVDVLIEAMALLLTDFPELQLEIAGGGAGRDVIEGQVVALNLSHAVIFRGELPRGDVAAFLFDADIVIVPSRLEPFGLVALEAAQVGRPVVASAVGGLPEIVLEGETGILVPPEDPRELAAAIGTLLKSPSLANELAMKARDRAMSHFRWQTYVDDYERVLEAAC
jgi:glycogen synthase